LCSIAYGDHGNHGGNSDNDAQCRKAGAHFIAAQRTQSNQ